MTPFQPYTKRFRVTSTDSEGGIAIHPVTANKRRCPFRTLHHFLTGATRSERLGVTAVPYAKLKEGTRHTFTPLARVAPVVKLSGANH